MLKHEDALRWRKAALIGGLLALVPYLWLINAGRLDPFAEKPFGDFYDAQAHSLLDGRLDVPPEIVTVEGFENDGRTYLYFGPVPAVMRMPISAVTDELDGRLTQTSMTLAVIAAMAFGSRLHRRLRVAAVGDRRLSRAEVVGAGGLTFAIGAGSSMLFLASTPIVYHEAISWGVAFSLLAYERLLAWRSAPSTGRIVALGVTITVALLTRSSVGGGPLAALALFAGLDLLRRRLDVRGALHLGAAILVPLVVYCGLNLAKFDSLLSVPFQNQGINEIQADRAEVLEANDGTIFGLRFLPSTTLQFVRPDAFEIDRDFPYLDFPEPATIVGDVTFDDTERSSSVPVTMPVWTALGLYGAVMIARRRELWRLAVPALGAAAGVAVTLTIGYIGQRYTADALPVLFITGSVGLTLLLHRERARVWLAGAATLLAVTSLVVFAFAIRYQREWGLLIDEELRAELVRFQYGDAPALGSLPAPPVGDELPGVITAPGTLFVIGDCDATYFAKDETWEPVERMPEGGRFVMELTLPESWEPTEIVATVGLEPTPAADGRLGFTVNHRDRTSEPIPYVPGRPFETEVVVDWRIGFVRVDVEGETILEDFYDGPREDAALNASFPGTVELAAREPSACHAATSTADRD